MTVSAGAIPDAFNAIPRRRFDIHVFTDKDWAGDVLTTEYVVFTAGGLLA